VNWPIEGSQVISSQSLFGGGDPHVTIVGARTDDLNGVRWPFRNRDGRQPGEHLRPEVR